MALSASDLKDKLITMMDSKKSEASSTDYMKEIASVISDYITNNLEGTVSWIATNPTSGATDTTTSTTAKVAELEITWNKELITGMTDSSIILSTLNDTYSESIKAMAFCQSDDATGFAFVASNELNPKIKSISICCPCGSDTETKEGVTSILYWFKDFNGKKHGGTDGDYDKGKSILATYKDNMEYLANSVVNSIKAKGLSLIVAGTHGAFVASGSTITELK